MFYHAEGNRIPYQRTGSVPYDEEKREFDVLSVTVIITHDSSVFYVLNSCEISNFSQKNNDPLYVYR